MNDLAPAGAVEIRGTFEYRDPEGNIVGTADFGWLPPTEALQQQELKDDNLGE